MIVLTVSNATRSEPYEANETHVGILLFYSEDLLDYISHY